MEEAARLVAHADASPTQVIQTSMSLEHEPVLSDTKVYAP